MGGNDRQHREGESCGTDTAALLEPVLAALSDSDEAERYRLVGALFCELANHTRSGGDGRKSAEQIEVLTKRVQALSEENATLNDVQKATRAELAKRDKQLEAEQTGAEQLQRIVDDRGTRLMTAQKARADLEAQLVARNSELHRVQVECEGLMLKLQRAERDASAQDRIDSLETGNRELAGQLAALRIQTEQLRADKDAEIERVQKQLRQAQSVASVGADALLMALWHRLASAKPSLAEGHLPPTPEAAERLVDALVALVRFADDFDKGMRVFLGKYTKHEASVREQWGAYAAFDDVQRTAQLVLAPQAGQPVGRLKQHLRLVYRWTQAAMVGCDAAIESIESELKTHLLGPHAAGADPNCRIRDYVKREDGPALFEEHIKKLRSQNVANAYGRGG